MDDSLVCQHLSGPLLADFVHLSALGAGRVRKRGRLARSLLCVASPLANLFSVVYIYCKKCKDTSLSQPCILQKTHTKCPTGSSYRCFLGLLHLSEFKRSTSEVQRASGCTVISPCTCDACLPLHVPLCVCVYSLIKNVRLGANHLCTTRAPADVIQQ